MAPQRFCKDCIQKHDCKRIYEQLGDSVGPSVTLNVILAFLLPLVVFIVSLAVFERVLADTADTTRIQTDISFVLALPATFICILITRVIRK